MCLMSEPTNLRFSSNGNFRQSKVSIQQHCKHATTALDWVGIHNCPSDISVCMQTFIDLHTQI
jgi:hypothetical protein